MTSSPGFNFSKDSTVSPTGNAQPLDQPPSDVRKFTSSEMTQVIEAFDWSQTPLGAMAKWPQSLKTMLNVCLHSHFQLAIYWGPDHIFLYNDAEREVIGSLCILMRSVNLHARSWSRCGTQLDPCCTRCSSVEKQPGRWISRLRSTDTASWKKYISHGRTALYQMTLAALAVSCWSLAEAGVMNTPQVRDFLRKPVQLAYLVDKLRSIVSS